MAFIGGPGVTTIFTSTAGSTIATGSWYEILPTIGALAWQVKLQTSSAGATAATTVTIEVSNDSSLALATVGQTIALTATTDAVSDGAVLASSMRGPWRYIRARMNSLTTSTAGSTGSPAVNVYMSAGYLTRHP